MKINFKRAILKRTIIFVLTLSMLLSFSIYGLAEEANYSSLEDFQKIIYLIKHYYVEDKKVEELVETAIDGLLEEMDPYSSYLSVDEYGDMQSNIEGHFGGIGIIITTKNNKLTIISPIKGTPGEKVGLESGDIIKAINGKATADMSQEKAVELMRGEEGTCVELAIEREGEEENLVFEIVRADIKIPNMEHEMLEENIAYIMFRQFREKVGEELNTAINELESQGAEALILDLRFNPGGLLTEAVNVSSNFISDDVVVKIKQRKGEDVVLRTNKLIERTDLPLVVLINGGSASASEIVAGAMQDYNRGTLMGTQSFGKGTVQTIIPLNDGTALRLTTARYYTPGDRFIHEKGIEPDIIVEYDKEYEGDNQLDRALEYIKQNFN